jgi:hypothetical protein
MNVKIDRETAKDYLISEIQKNKQLLDVYNDIHNEITKNASIGIIETTYVILYIRNVDSSYADLVINLLKLEEYSAKATFASVGKKLIISII